MQVKELFKTPINSPNNLDLKHLGYLDGLRGFAILLVVACHAGWCTYGFFGVWIFFSLSGYLIGSIILKKQECSNFYKAFYARRFLRIAPLYLVTVGVVFLFFPDFLPKAYDKAAGLTVYLFYLQNFIPSLLNPVLGHTWSLALEEYFYLILPTTIKNLRPIKAIENLCFHLMWLGPLLRVVLLYFLPTFHFKGLSYSLLSFEVFAYGVWLASREFQEIPLNQSLKSLSFITAILSLVTWLAFQVILGLPYFWQTPFNPELPGLLIHQPLFILMPPLSGLLLALILKIKTLQNIFSFKPLVFTGELSYAIYLFHGLLIPTHLKPLEWIPLSFLLAFISRYTIELPVLSIKKFFEFKTNHQQTS
jgi:peptidoglycan/LPS O-acetylase OafA/YrhL